MNRLDSRFLLRTSRGERHLVQINYPRIVEEQRSAYKKKLEVSIWYQKWCQETAGARRPSLAIPNEGFLGG